VSFPPPVTGLSRRRLEPYLFGRPARNLTSKSAQAMSSSASAAGTLHETVQTCSFRARSGPDLRLLRFLSFMQLLAGSWLTLRLFALPHFSKPTEALVPTDVIASSDAHRTHSPHTTPPAGPGSAWTDQPTRRPGAAARGHLGAGGEASGSLLRSRRREYGNSWTDNECRGRSDASKCHAAHPSSIDQPERSSGR
jgi:hypothetical protein